MLSNRNREMCNEIRNILYGGGCSNWSSGRTSVECEHRLSTKAVVKYDGKVFAVIGATTLTISTNGVRNNVLSSRINAIFQTFGLPEMCGWKIDGENIVDGEPYMIPESHRCDNGSDDEDDDYEDDDDDGWDEEEYYDDDN